MTASKDTRSTIQLAVENVLKDIPALRSLKIVLALELRGRGDVQIYRVELPDLVIKKDLATDARVRVLIGRADFNELAEGQKTINSWHEAFRKGVAKATGPQEILKLISSVVDRQLARSKSKKIKP